MTDRPIVALDTETTSLVPPYHPQGRQTWEIAGIRCDPDGATATFLFHLPVDLTHADPDALRIGGYWKRSPQVRGNTRDHEKAVKAMAGDGAIYHYTGALDHHYREWFIDRLWRLLSGATIVGSNPGFDMVNVSHLFTQAKMPGHLVEPWHYKPYDIAAHGSSALGLEGTGPSTADLSEKFGITRPVEHTALADAAWALAMRDAIEAVKQGRR